MTLVRNTSEGDPQFDGRGISQQIDFRTIQEVTKVSPLEGASISGGKSTVSVVIPCFNYAQFLREAVESALSQTGVAVNVIIVDDASTDRSLSEANALADEDSRVHVLAHSVNRGPVDTFNDGLKHANGDFLVRLDADDLLTPGSLIRSVTLMRQYPSVGLVYGHPLHFSGSRLPAARTKATRWTIWPGQQWLSDRCRDGYNVITSPEVLMRTSVVERVGGQKHLDHTHDMEMWLRISAYADVAYIHGADQAWHREHAGSLSAREVNTYRDLIERQKAFDVLFDGIRGHVADADTFHLRATAAIASQAVAFACRELDHGHDDSATIEAFIDFARSTTGTVESLPGWRSFEKRIGPGRKWTVWHPGAMQARAARWWQRVLRNRRWHRSGVF